MVARRFSSRVSRYVRVGVETRAGGNERREKNLRFEEALHAYHRVENILKARVAGLDTVRFIDKTDSNRKKIQNGEIAVSSETDRMYLDTSGAIDLEDPGLRRRTRVAKDNSRTTVVWNPWVQKAHSMSDFADDEWIQMICIETSNVSEFAVDLAPGEQHMMRAVVRIADLLKSRRDWNWKLRGPPTGSRNW